MNFALRLVISATLSVLLGSTLPCLAANEQPKPAETQKPQEPAKPEQHAAKIGFIEVSKIAEESAPGKAAHAEMKEKSDKLRAKITAKQKQIEKLKESFEAKAASLSAQQRAAKTKEFQKKVEEYQKFVTNAEKELQGRQTELLSKLLKAIEKAATDYGKANHFTAIVPKKEVFFLADSVEVKDVTDEIIKQLPEK